MKKIIAFVFGDLLWLLPYFFLVLYPGRGCKAQNNYFFPVIAADSPATSKATLQRGNIKAHFKSNAFALDFFRSEFPASPRFAEGGRTRLPCRAYRLAIELVGANPNVKPVFLDKAPPVVHSYKGNARFSMPTYKRLLFKDIYPNIDILYYFPENAEKEQGLAFEYDFIARPGADPRDIRLRIVGGEKVGCSSKTGAQLISFPGGSVTQSRPLAFSLENFNPDKYNRRPSSDTDYVKAGWVYNEKTDFWGFELGAYDTQKTLAIDPILWATLLGGSQADNAEAIAIDPTGANYITGSTFSNDLNIPPGAWQSVPAGNAEVWTAKFNKCGQLLWLTYLGGAEDEFSASIAVNANNEVYIGGTTFSADFPLQPDSGKYNQSFQGLAGIFSDGFIAKLDSDGNLLWSTYVGGGGNSFDEVLKIAVAPDNKVACVGFTTSSSFPTTNNPGQYNQPFGGNNGDGFLFLLSPQDTLLWSTYLGGTDQDRAAGVAFNGAGNFIYVAGTTFSLDFPVTQNSGQYFQVYSGQGASDAFITQFSAAGDYNWGTFYGGSGDETTTDIKVAPTGEVCVIGGTSSSDFPITHNPGQYSQALAGFWDAMALSFNASGGLLWATALGGSSGSEQLEALQFAPPSNWLAVGKTGSADLPLQSGGAFQNNIFGGMEDIMLARFHVNSGGLNWSSYLGSPGLDFAKGIALDDCQNAVLVAGTDNATLPQMNQPGQFIQSFAGVSDAYILKFGDSLACSLPPGPPSAIALARCGPGSVTISAFMGSPAGSSVLLYDSPFTSVALTFSHAAPYELLTPEIMGPTTFYLQTEDLVSGCYSPTRTSLEVNISPIPSPPTAPQVSLCSSSSVTFTASMGQVPGSVIYLYTQEDASAPIDSTFTIPYLLTAPLVTTTSTFYLAAKLGACESGAREPVFVLVSTSPAAPTVAKNSITICGKGAVTFTVQMGNPSGDEIHLYTQEQGGQPIALGINELTAQLNAGETQSFWIGSHYSQTGCGSANRVPVTATSIVPPGPPTAQNVSRCGAGSVTISAFLAIPPGDEVALYATPFGGEPIAVDATAPYTFTTAELTTTTTYFLGTRYTSNGCASETRTPVVAQLSEGPTPPLVSNIQRCDNGLVTFTALGVPQGHSVRVYTQAEGGRPVGNLEREPFLFPTAANQSTTYYFTSVDPRTGCESLIRSSATVAIFASEEPIINTNQLTRCGSGSLTFTVLLPNPGVGTEVRLLQNQNPESILSSAVVEPYVLTTPVISTSTTYYVQVINRQTGCSTLKPVFLNVANRPNPPIVQNIRLCGVTQTIVTVLPNNSPAPEIRLYESIGSTEPLDARPIAPYLFPLENLTTSATYYFSAAYGACESEKTPLRIDVIQLGIPQMNSITVCGGGAVTLTGTMGSPAGTEIRLYDAPQDGQLVAASASAPFTFALNNIATNTVFYASAFHSGLGCESDRKPVSVSVLPLPAVSGGVSEITRCGAGSVSFSFLTNATTQIRLYTQSRGGESINESQGPLHQFIFPNITTSTGYWVEAIDVQTGCSSGARTLISINVVEKPTPPAAANIARCGPGNIAFTAAQGRPAGSHIELLSEENTLLQSQPGNFAIFDQINVGTTTTFYLRANNNGCFSETAPVVATVLPKPEKPEIQVSAMQLCAPGNVTFSLPATFSGADTIWGGYYVPNIGASFIALQAGQRSAEVFITQSATFYFTRQSALCPGDTLFIPITLAPTVAPLSVSNLIVCRGANANFAISNALGRKVRITDASSTLLDSIAVCLQSCNYQIPALQTTTTFYFEAIDLLSGCKSSMASAKAEVLPSPAPPIASNISVCSAGVFTLTAQMGAPAGQAIALYADPTASPLLTVSGNPALLTTPFLTSSATFYLETFNFRDECKSAKVPVIVTFENNLPSPAVSAVSACAGSMVTFTIQPVALPAGTVARVFASENAAAPLATLSSLPFTYTVNAVSSATFYFDFYQSAAQCNGLRSAANLQVLPTPAAPPPLELSHCGSNLLYAFAGNNQNYDIVLYSIPQATTPLAVLPANSSSYSFTQSQNLFYSLRDKQSGCESEKSRISVQIIPDLAPPVLANALIGFCEGVRQFTINGIQTEASATGIKLYSQALGGNPIAEANRQPFSFALNIPTGATFIEYYLESYSAACSSSSRAKVTLFADPTLKPAPVTVSSVSRCGTGVVTFSPTMGFPAGSEIQLFENATGGTALASSAAPFSITTPVISQSTTFYVQATNGSCEGVRTPVSAIVHRLPLSPNVAALSRCGAGNIQFTVSNVFPTDKIFVYTQPSGGASITESNNGIINIAATQSTIYYLQTVNIEAPQCSSQRTPLSITVTSPPLTPIVSKSIVCQGAAASVAFPPQPNEVVLNIYSGSSVVATIGGAPWIWAPGALSATTTYFVEAAQGNCVGQRQSLVIEVLPKPAPPALSAQSLTHCGPGAFNLQATSTDLNGDVFRVYDATHQLVFQTSQSPLNWNTGILTTSSTYYVTSWNARLQCESEKQAVNLIILEQPTLSLPQSLTVCRGQNLSYTAPGNWAEANWRGPGGFLGSTPSLNLQNVDISQAGIYTLEVKASNGCAATSTTRLLVNEPPPAPVAPNVTLCQSGNATVRPLALPMNTSALRIYTEPNGGLFVTEKRTAPWEAVLPFINTTATFYVEIEANGCKSERSPFVVQVAQPPVITASSGTVQRCGGGPVTFSVFSSAATLARLYSAPGAAPLAIQSGGPDFVFENWGAVSQNSTYYVEALNGSCASALLPISVQVHPIPAPPILSDYDICGGGSLIITVNAASTVSLQLYATATAPNPLQVIANPFVLNLQSVTTSTAYWMNAKDNLTGCESSRISFKVNVLPAPATPIVAPQTVCAGASLTFTVGAGAPNPSEVFLWDNFNATIPLQTTQAFPYVFTISNISLPTTYYVQSRLGACSSPKVAVSIGVLPRPAVQVQSPVTRCGAGQVLITANVSAPGSVVRLYQSQQDNNALATVIQSPYILESPLVAGPTVFYLEAELGSCKSERVPVNIQVLPLPQVPILQAPSFICGPGNATLTVFTSQPGIALELWQETPSRLIENQATTGANYFSIMVAQTTQLKLRSVHGICQSSFTPFTIEVKPLPAPPVLLPVSRCGNGSVVFTAQLQGAANIAYLYESEFAQNAINVSGGFPFTLATPWLTTTTTFWASSGDGVCQSPRVPVTASVLPLPAEPVFRSMSRCGPGALTFTSQNLPVGGSLWVALEPGNTVLQTLVITSSAQSVSLNLMQSQNYSAWVVLNGCTSQVASFSGTIHSLPEPPQPINPAVLVCGTPATALFSAILPTPNSTLELRDLQNNVLATASSAPFSASVTVGQSQSFLLYAKTRQGCESSPVRVQVITQPRPAPPTSADIEFICNSQVPVTFTVQMGAPAGNEIRMYDSQVGGNLLATSFAAPYLVSTPPLSQATTFYLASALGACESERTPVVANCVKERACGAPGNILAQAIDANNATVSWESTPNAVCYIVTYEPLGVPGAQPQTILAPAPTTSAQLSRLLPGTRYIVRVRANCTMCSMNNGNISPIFNSVQFQTFFARAKDTAVEGNMPAVYPNPTNGIVFLDFSALNYDDWRITLWESSGKSVYSSFYSLINEENRLTLDFSDLPGGIYTLSLQNTDFIYINKLILSK